MPDRVARRRCRLDAALAATIVGFAIFVGAVIWGFWQRAEITDRICQAQVADRAALRKSFVLAEQLSLTRRPLTAAEQNNVRRFWQRLLASIPPLHCEHGQPHLGRKQ